MADYDLAKQMLAQNEGNWANNSKDKGKETFKGISRYYYPLWKGWPIVDGYKLKPGFPGNMKDDHALNQLVDDFFYETYWMPVHGNDIRDQLQATSIFDFAVNAGLSTSVRIVQQCIGAKVDGDFGGMTLAKLLSFDVVDFMEKFTIRKLKRYAAICRADPSQRDFLYIWVQRLLKFSPY